MPHLQSIVIVLLKVILTNVSAMVNHANAQNGHGMGYFIRSLVNVVCVC